MSDTTTKTTDGIDLTREMLEEACRSGDGPKPGHDSLGYCIAVLHPGERMWLPSASAHRVRSQRNLTDRTVAYRWSHGMGHWIGPVDVSEILADDPPTVCTCGIDRHRPRHPQEILAEQQAVRERADNRDKAARRWAAVFVERHFNHGAPLSSEAINVHYPHVYQGLIAQWYADNPDDEETPE